MEFDLSPKVAERENMSMEQLIGRAQGMWEGATRFEYDRALQAEADGDSSTIGDEADGGGDGSAADDDDDDDGPVVFPYILCSKDIVGEADKVAQWGGTTTTTTTTSTGTGQQQTVLQRKKSGFDRRLLIQEAIANATSRSELYRDGKSQSGGFDASAVVLKDMFNGRGAYCAVASLPGSIAMALEFDGCVVQPMLLATKLGAGTVTLAVAIVNKLENSTKIDMDVPDDLEDLIEEQVHTPGSSTNADEDDVVPTEGKFPGVTVSLCPGFLSADDVFNLQSGRPVKQKKVQRIMTEWLLGKTADGEDTTDRIKQNLYWTSSSRDSASTTTDRGKFWGEIMDRVSEPNACAVTFKKRLTWSLEPGLSESSFTNLHVSYDNRGASNTDHDCVLAAIAGFSIHPDICFFEFDLEKTPQVEYRQHLRSSQQTHQQHIQGRRERATHRPNADWMVQSYVEQARPFFDAGINGTGVVVAVSDTGLDVDNCYFHDATNPIGMSHRKIVSYDVAKGDVSDYEGGHGTVSTHFCLMHSIITFSYFTDCVNFLTNLDQTKCAQHVVGLIAGKKSKDGIFLDTDGQGDGVAPGAKIAFLDTTVGTSGYAYPSDNVLLTTGRDNSDAEANVARLHSASWGVRGQNTYTAQAATFDDYMFQNEDFLMILAAGNGGRYGRLGSIYAPSTSKNSICVGAAHSAEDDLTDDLAGSNYIADFSGKGMTGDGRIAPDIVAPGKFLLAAGAQPDLVGECDPENGDLPEIGYNSVLQGLKYDAGTSMATPVVSGTAALVIQYFQDGFYPGGERKSGPSISPSNALVKAVILNGAQTAGIEGVDNLDLGIAAVKPYDGNIGFGQIDLLTSLYIKGKSFVQTQIWDRQTIEDGESMTFTATIDRSNGCDFEAFTATLVWFEPASATYCNKCLLNDLDLYVTKNGDDLKYYPNGRSTKDSVNTVERVILGSGVVDDDVFTIHVEASNLSTKSQKFALVSTGCFGGEASEYSGMTYGSPQNNSASSSGKAAIIAISVVGGVALLAGIALLVLKHHKHKESF